MPHPVPKTSVLVAMTVQLSTQFGTNIQSTISQFLHSYPNTADLRLVQNFHAAATALAASPAFRAMRDEDEDDKHCVRCHSEFTEDDNDDDSCVIPHLYDSESASRSGPDMYTYEARCCD